MNVPNEVVKEIAISCQIEEEVIINREKTIVIGFGDLQSFANAIAKWQREKDAELCGNIKKFYTKHYALGAGECAESILNQGEE